MIGSHPFLARLLIVLGACLVAAATPTVASAAQRYASDDGSGGTCSAASPCSIKQAINYAGAGDEVIVEPGYYLLSAPQGALLQIYDPATITIHGILGQPPPRIVFDGPEQNGLLLSHDSTLRHVLIEQAQPGKSTLTSEGAAVDRVTLKGSFGGACTARISRTVMRNSVVVGNDEAICSDASSGVSTFRNVTAVSTGADAIDAYAHGASANVAVHLVNVIAKAGPGFAGLAIRTDNSGGHATITATHTNFASYWSSGTNAQYIDGGGNQGTPPTFVGPGVGDFRQTPGSVTINSGINDPANGAFDLDGEPRQFGTTDIGADEFARAPAVSTGPASTVTDHSATLSGNIDAQGAPTSYHFEYGPTTAYGAVTPTANAGAGGPVAATASVGALRPVITYHYRLVASNAGGVTKGADRTFTTASAPSGSSTTPTPPGSTLTGVFAGVRPVATRLTYGGSFITLRLSCPAGTVGRCSGRTRLSARRRAGSRTVTLGRAPFSIAAGTRARVKVRITRAGRRMLGRARRLRAMDVNVARDGTGRVKTTSARVTIRARRR